jgi:menaquinone-specific isochorismate synthase
MQQTVHPQLSEAADYLDQLREQQTAPLNHWLSESRDQGLTDQLLSFSFRFPNIDPLAYLEQQMQDAGEAYYWEQPSHDMAIAAGPALHVFQTRGPQRFATLQAAFDDLVSKGLQISTIEHSLTAPLLLSGFSFSNNEASSEHWDSFGSGQGYIPRWSLVREGQITLFTINLLVDPEDEWLGSREAIIDAFMDELELVSQQLDDYAQQPHPAHEKVQLQVSVNGSGTDREQWNRQINRAKDLIKSETFDKIVLAREQHVMTDRSIRPTRILNQLRYQYPECFTFMVRQKSGDTFLGSTPERLGAFYRSHMLTEGLAGSMSRGKTASEDAFYEKQLRNSSKNLREHAFVVEAIKDRLTPWSDRIQHPDEPGIKKLSNVQHLHTPITAWMNGSYRPLELVGELHPTPAVGGHPRDHALPYISNLESFDRGWYAAPVGWLNAHGRGEFAVAIRSALLHDDEAWLFAGCGIVADSDPDEEWEETELKLIPMKTALRYG